MKILSEPDNNTFPMKIKCRVPDQGTLAFYGRAVDYCGRELEVEASDIKKHIIRDGANYGVFCPGCGMFTIIPEVNIPKYVKREAEEVLIIQHGCVLQEIPEEKPERQFTFEYAVKEAVEAEDLNSAIKTFKAKHPDADIKGVEVANGQIISDMYSVRCNGRIYYRSGCKCGYKGCILDPMREVAKECRTQDEMTEDKWTSCKNYREFGYSCYNYNDGRTGV